MPRAAGARMATTPTPTHSTPTCQLVVNLARRVTARRDETHHQGKSYNYQNGPFLYHYTTPDAARSRAGTFPRAPQAALSGACLATRGRGAQWTSSSASRPTRTPTGGGTAGSSSPKCPRPR
eukprot:8486164-Pyramimonas_sp.AAC.1